MGSDAGSLGNTGADKAGIRRPSPSLSMPDECVNCGKSRREHPHIWCSEDWHDRRLYARRLVKPVSNPEQNS